MSNLLYLSSCSSPFFVPLPLLWVPSCGGSSFARRTRLSYRLKKKQYFNIYNNLNVNTKTPNSDPVNYTARIIYGKFKDKMNMIRGAKRILYNEQSNKLSAELKGKPEPLKSDRGMIKLVREGGVVRVASWNSGAPGLKVLGAGLTFGQWPEGNIAGVMSKKFGKDIVKLIPGRFSDADAAAVEKAVYKTIAYNIASASADVLLMHNNPEKIKTGGVSSYFPEPTAQNNKPRLGVFGHIHEDVGIQYKRNVDDEAVIKTITAKPVKGQMPAALPEMAMASQAEAYVPVVDELFKAFNQYPALITMEV